MPRMSPLSPTYEPQPPSIPYPCVNFLPFLNYLLTTLTTVACTIQLVWSKLLFFLQIIILSHFYSICLPIILTLKNRKGLTWTFVEWYNQWFTLDICTVTGFVMTQGEFKIQAFDKSNHNTATCIYTESHLTTIYWVSSLCKAVESNEKPSDVALVF